RRCSPRTAAGTPSRVSPPSFYTPVQYLQALIGRAFLPVRVLVVLEDRAAGDDGGLAVRALHHLAQIKILDRHPVDVVGEGPTHRIELRLADGLGESDAVLVFPARGLQAGGDDAGAVVGLRRIVRGIPSIRRDEVL